MLALDPYYEMFPSSYQRPYPYWYYGLGAPSLDELDEQLSDLQFVRRTIASRPTSLVFVDSLPVKQISTGADLQPRLSGGLFAKINAGFATAGISPLRPRSLTVEEFTQDSLRTGALAQGFILLPQFDAAIAVVQKKIAQLEAAEAAAAPTKTATTPTRVSTTSRAVVPTFVPPSAPTTTAALPTKPLSNGAKIAIGAGIGVAILGIGVLLFGK